MIPSIGQIQKFLIRRDSAVKTKAALILLPFKVLEVAQGIVDNDSLFFVIHRFNTQTVPGYESLPY